MGEHTPPMKAAPMYNPDNPAPTAAEHLARAEELLKRLERELATNAGDPSASLTAKIAQLHIMAAHTLAQVQVAEAHATMADIITAYSIDARDIEDKDHGPESWPPLPT